jgi:hypothetical protein
MKACHVGTDDQDNTSTMYYYDGTTIYNYEGTAIYYYEGTRLSIIMSIHTRKLIQWT